MRNGSSPSRGTTSKEGDDQDGRKNSETIEGPSKEEEEDDEDELIHPIRRGQGSPDPVQAQSKKQLKRQIKRRLALEERPAKRAAERARKKARKQESKQSHLDREPTSTLQSTHQATKIFPSIVVFDCRFDDRMSEKEIVSLDRQLAHSYAINRRAKVQFERLICTSFNGRLSQRFQANGNQYLRWKSFKFTPRSIEDLVPQACSSSVQDQQSNRTDDQTDLTRLASIEHDDDDDDELDDRMEADPDPPPNHPSSDPHLDLNPPMDRKNPQNQSESWIPQKLNKSDVIYLTADSNNLLETIDPNKIYVIGSIVDRNRYKNLCLDVSNQHGFNHAQLPIDRYFSKLKTRKVLTVNQVLDILVRFLEESDWEKAFEKVIPSRKL